MARELLENELEDVFGGLTSRMTEEECDEERQEAAEDEDEGGEHTGLSDDGIDDVEGVEGETCRHASRINDDEDDDGC